MPQTTGAVNGCDVVIRLDNSAGALTDISGSSNKVELELDNEIGEFRTFASNWAGRIMCGQDASVSLDVIYSLTAAEAMAILKEWYFTTRNKRTLELNIPDNATGSDRYTMESVLESLSIPAPADEADPIMVSTSLLPDGAVTLATI